MTKIVIFTFRAEPQCMLHALLYVLDLEENALWGEIVFEEESTKLIPEMAKPDHFLHQPYLQAKTRGLLWGACLACSNKMGVTHLIEAENIPLVGDLSGHPSISHFVKQDYMVLTL
jgi:hypothetical protein